MKLQREGRRRGGMLAKEGVLPEQIPEIKIPAREKLLEEWSKWKNAIDQSWWRKFSDGDPGPYEWVMKLVQIIGAVAPERLPGLSVDPQVWGEIKKFFEYHARQRHITRMDMWLDHAVGARLFFPEQAQEIIPLIRPFIQFALESPYFISDENIADTLIDVHLADPENPGWSEVVGRKLPVIRERFLAAMQDEKFPFPAIHLGARLFLLSPEDRLLYQEQLNAYIERHRARINQDLGSGKTEGKFAGYFLEEPWYSVAVTPTARLEKGRIVFKKPSDIPLAELPERFVA